LHASGFLPEVWMPDEETEARRRVVAERTQLVSQMNRLKNRIQSVLHANLIPPYKGVLFSQRGRAWLEAQPLAEDQRRSDASSFAMPENSTALAPSSRRWIRGIDTLTQYSRSRSRFGLAATMASD